MLARMPAPVFERWKIVYRLMPAGHERLELAIARVVLAVLNALPNGADLLWKMPRAEWEGPKRMSDEEMKAAVERFAKG